MRINVFQYDGGDKILAGWFDDAKAVEISEDTDWDGNNSCSVHTREHGHHQSLYRTVGGRWVLCTWSDWQGMETRHQFITDEVAQRWLIVNGSDDVIAEYFGELPSERGPGRPEIGQPVNTRLGGELLAAVDAEASLSGQTRAETLRVLVTEALAARESLAAHIGNAAADGDDGAADTVRALRAAIEQDQRQPAALL